VASDGEVVADRELPLGIVPASVSDRRVFDFNRLPANPHGANVPPGLRLRSRLQA